MEEDKQVQEILARSIPLQNGLSLNIYDRSRRVAGDRWWVSLSARIDIPVGRIASTEDRSDPAPSDLKALLGESLVFELKRSRNFIDDRLKISVFQEISDSLVSSLMAYVSRPDFARRFVLKEYRKRLTQQAGQRDLPESA